MEKYFLTVIYILSFITTIYSSELQSLSANENEFHTFFAGQHTPVWFIESNLKDSKKPYLSQITEALYDAGLISQDSREESASITSSNTDLSPLKAEKDMLYLEILVVVDYGLYKKLGENVKSTLKYVTSFWNGVDLRYRLITSPLVYINIAGIIIAKDPNALYYVQESKNNRGHVIANKVLFEAGKYFLYERKINNYDIPVTMTTEDLCSMSSTNICYSDIVGLSLLGKACSSHLNTAIIEDNGGFKGIIAATHEIAHLLNVPHDGEGEAARCSTSAGNIMTHSASISENNFLWSQCSKDILQKFSLTSDADCLRNKPNPGSPAKRILPGKLLNVFEQCARAGYSVPCANGRRVCNVLSCFRLDSKICDTDGPAAEGSSCGSNLYCRDGQCVPDV